MKCVWKRAHVCIFHRVFYSEELPISMIVLKWTGQIAEVTDCVRITTQRMVNLLYVERVFICANPNYISLSVTLLAQISLFDDDVEGDAHEDCTAKSHGIDD